MAAFLTTFKAIAAALPDVIALIKEIGGWINNLTDYFSKKKAIGELKDAVAQARLGDTAALHQLFGGDNPNAKPKTPPSLPNP